MGSKDERAKKLGAWGERKARAYLEGRGFEFLFANYRTPHGELDLIMRKGEQIHFIEVKTRSSTQFGFPEEAVDQNKANHLIASAENFLQENPDLDSGWQIDVVAIWVQKDRKKPEIKYFENAVQ